MNGKPPDRLFIDVKDRELYEELNNDVFICTELKEAKTKFFYAMAIGFKNKIRQPLDSKDGYVRAEYLHPKDEALMNAVAIYATDDVNIITNRDKVFNIVEEYAHAGIRLLYDAVNSGQPGSYYKKLEMDLREIPGAFVND